MTYAALATLDDNAALAEIASGTLSKQIAARYGVTPFAVRKRLAKHPDYPEAIKSQAASLVEDATQLAMTCSNDEVAIARVRVDAAHKWAAARDPASWGAKQQMTVDVHHDVSDRLQADLSALLGRVVDTQQIAHRDSAEEGIGVMSSHDALPEGNTLTSAEHGVSPTMPEDDPVSP